MKILIVDKTSEGQASLARLVDSFDSNEQDTLDLSVSLSGEADFIEKLPKFDVLLLGPGFAEDSGVLARKARAAAPSVQIIMIVTEETYSTDIFRLAHVSGVRKVLCQSAPSLDLLQELVSIHEEFKRAGRAKSGTLVVVTHAKGGVGATTLCAALAESCNEQGRSTLLWDFDFETRDLCRALTVSLEDSGHIEGWLDGSLDLTRQSFKESLLPVGDNTSIFRPPASLAARHRLAGSSQGTTVLQRMVELARCSHDNIIVDLAGRLSQGAEVLLRAADKIVVVIDDSVLGLSAAHELVGTLVAILKSADPIRIVCSGTTLEASEIAQQLNAGQPLPELAFSLPQFPTDVAASRWPGTGKTLYRSGKRETQIALEKLGQGLGLLVDWHEPLKVVTSSGKTKVVSRRESAKEQEWGALRLLMQKVSGFSLF